MNLSSLLSLISSATTTVSYTTSTGTGMVDATSSTWIMQGRANASDSFVINENDFIYSNGTKHPILIQDFYGANENTPGLGVGQQDFVAFTGFHAGSSIKSVLGVSDGHGGKYFLYDVADGAQHFDLIVHSMNGGQLVNGFDYWIS